MRHNQQVADNIRQIKEQVEASKSQDDLVKVIEDVAQHPGPLDYNDNASYALAGLLFSTLVYAFYSQLFSPLYYSLSTEVIDNFFRFIIINSSVWVPGLISLYTVLWLDNNGKKYYLDQYIEQPLLRFAAAAIVPTLLLYPIQLWHGLYWGLLDTIGELIGLGYEAPIGGYGITTGIVLFFLWRYLRARSNWRKPVSNRIFLLDTLFNNGIDDISSQCADRYGQLYSRYADFKRGNDTRELLSLYQGHYKGDVHNFDFQIYHFHYVVKTTRTTTDSDGNTRTTTTRTSYYRHGLVLPFPFAQNLTLSNDGGVNGNGVKYQTASTVFNKIFKVRAGSEMDAARFLSPAVIEKLSTLKEQVRRPVVEFSYDKQLCLSFADDDLITLKRQHSLENPSAFAEEISSHADLKKLDGLLDLIHELMRLSDNNFADNTTHTFNSQPVASVAEQTSD
ncbi:DUF3137 domain-containing protein [Oceanospirillum sanctuarii]|uniref:DUF3137 domain-containing protein n=1 Tax=Oceanospirillum sanctuarii TaxID=1434821 RepID=UPI000A3749BD|nr:DUF3137 domain-containing protein [Oceanospirillum sanctuarii]